MNQRDGVEFSGREFGVDIFVIDVFAPIDLKRLGVFAATFRDIEPFVGEGAAHAAKDAAIDEVADRCFHHAPGGGSGKENRLFCSEQFLQFWVNLAVEILECFAAVSDHRPGECGERFFRNLDRTGNEKFIVRSHGATFNVQRPTSNVQRRNEKGGRRSGASDKRIYFFFSMKLMSPLRST